MIDLNEIFKFSEKVNVEVNAAQVGKHKNSIYRHKLAHFLVTLD